ncbi:MAG TPA: hypothetical protein VHW69_18265 [Rhizomicrobium sp.]|nr:hypothetical protein [Rhizomicrobium sp.]
MKIVAAGLMLLVAASSAKAALSRAQFDSVSISPSAGARLDPALSAPDASGKWRTIGGVLAGRPAFVSFVDYTCNTLCGTDLELLSHAIQTNRLAPSQYRILVIGIDPKDRPKDARAMERKEIPAALWPAVTMLLPEADVVRRATAALGFHYVYDPAIDQFAHPAIVYMIGADGGLRTALSPFALSTTNLRQLLSAPARANNLYERVRLLCYAYDPATGIYSLRIVNLLKIACLLALLAVAGAVMLLRRAGRSA